MCGFAGIFVNSDDIEKYLPEIEKMSNCIRHRGPDDSRIYKGDNALFAFRRLSIIDLDGGSQPFISKCGNFASVFNGEIYNYLELKKDLEKEGVTFSTNSEIEVIVNLYMREGAEFVKKLRGMFAILIYDKQNKTLFAARDPFGIKPLYYRLTDNGIKLSSEMKAFFFDSEYEAFDVNNERLQNYFTFQYVTEPDTITNSIKILPKGSYMVFSQSAEIKEYYAQSFAPDVKTSYEVKRKKLRETVEESVAAHMLSDVPLGSFLSSGIDSAVITAVASKLQPGIKAFTVGFNVKGYTELADAKGISSHLDIDHILLECNLDDFLKSYERVIYHLDSPVADPSVVAIYLISKEAARHVKVVLSGEGSDEMFAGYRVYDSSRSADKIANLPCVIKAPLKLLYKMMPAGMKGKHLLERGLIPVEKRFVGNSFVFTEKAKKSFLKTFDPNVSYTDRTAPIYAKTEGYTSAMKMQYCDFNTWLPSDILVKGDRLSMANALEVRVPFLDKKVYDVARTLCDGDKLTENTTKYILRDAFRDILNAETIVRPKLGYPVPVRAWLKDELYDWAKEKIITECAEEYIDKNGALKLLEDHRKGKRDLYHEIWSILVFNTWYKMYVTDAEGTKKKIETGEL